jgi:hypothetical protein
MKRIVLFTCTTLLITNFLFGLLLSSYEWFNVLLSSGIIILFGIFMLLIGIMQLKDGFRSSLYVLYPILGFIELILSLFSPNKIMDNWVIIVLTLIVVFQLILLFITKVISNRIQNGRYIINEQNEN